MTRPPALSGSLPNRKRAPPKWNLPHPPDVDTGKGGVPMTSVALPYDPAIGGRLPYRPTGSSRSPLLDLFAQRWDQGRLDSVLVFLRAYAASPVDHTLGQSMLALAYCEL